MDEKTFKLEIITPTRVVYNGDVVSFSAPGVMGGFQILFNHAPMLAQVGVGVVKLREPNGSEQLYATSGGFVDVIKNQVVMLAETVEHCSEIDIKRAETARERAKQKLSDIHSDTEKQETRSALERAVNRLHVAEKR
jgi:F-type H+-transporting ATPase subunit epsilon